MSRNLLVASLLLSMLLPPAGAVLAEDTPQPAPDPNAAGEPARQDTQEQADKEGAEAEKKAADPQAKKDEGPKALDGMSILGNQDAPKSLVIVPWKSSIIGASIGISTMLDDSRQPIDKEVFMRALSYYEIRSGRK